MKNVNRRWVKNLVLLNFLLGASAGLWAQTVVEMGADAVSLNAARADLYRTERWSKAQVRAQIYGYEKSASARAGYGYSDSVLAKLPDELVFYRFSNPGKFADGRDDCERNALALDRDFRADAATKAMTEQERLLAFDRKWRAEYPSCYFYYRNFAPILDFQFNLPASGRLLLTDVQVEMLYRSPSQATGIMKRSANADLMIPAAGLGLHSCMNKAQEGYQPYFSENALFILTQLIWAESYCRTIPGKYPAKEIFILRFHFKFQVEGKGEIAAISPYMILQV
jgi:hypothetical protein